MLRVVFVALAFVPAPVFAFCHSPSAPYNLRAPEAPGGYDRPDVPYCLSSYSYNRTHTCDDWEIDDYFSEVDDYVESLQTYLDEFNEYKRKVFRLAKEAETYANCEAEEVSTQHE